MPWPGSVSPVGSDNVQCSWVKLGDEQTAELLRGGANDIGGTLMEGDDQPDGRLGTRLRPHRGPNSPSWRPWPVGRRGSGSTTYQPLGVG